MLTPPDDIAEDALAAAVARAWSVEPASMAYRAVGFGSHHWEVADRTGTRWFLTVDELATKRHSLDEPLDVAFDRLRTALAVARDLLAGGYRFVVAPVPTVVAEPLARLGDRFAVALYPFVTGRSFRWREFSGPGHRETLLDLVAAVHSAPPAVRRRAGADDLAVPHRDELEAGLDPDGEMVDGGPYGPRTASLLAERAGPIRRLLARYDELVAEGRSRPSRAVLTHGEPHPGNTMLTADGWRLLDWDTALVAPPERDLWHLDPGDGSVLRGYERKTGVAPLPSILRLYRIRWNLADIAVEVSRFRRRHTGSAEDDTAWKILCSSVRSIDD